MIENEKLFRPEQIISIHQKILPHVFHSTPDNKYFVRYKENDENKIKNGLTLPRVLFVIADYMIEIAYLISVLFFITNWRRAFSQFSHIASKNTAFIEYSVHSIHVFSFIKMNDVT